MKSLFLTSVLILCCVLGCSRQSEVLSTRASLMIWENETTYALSEETTLFVEQILSKHPDINDQHHIELAPTVELTIGQASYTIQSDEIILMHDGGTKIWRSPDIQKKLIRAKQKQTAQPIAPLYGEQRSILKASSTP